jgi:hypothetical protein
MKKVIKKTVKQNTAKEKNTLKSVKKIPKEKSKDSLDTYLPQSEQIEFDLENQT